MTLHPNIERGAAVLEARLKNSPLAGQTAHPMVSRPFITLSRETGAGATTLGEMLVPLLDAAVGEPGHGWVFMDKNLIAHALAQQNLPERMAKYLGEGRISEIQAVIGELMGLHPPLWELEQQVVEAVLQLAQLGRVILVGRASYVVTRSLPAGFHVRLVAPLEVRMKRIMRILNCSEATARAYILENDRGRERFLRTRFDREIGDAHLYDLVINTERMAPATSARLIVEALRDRVAGLQGSRPPVAGGTSTEPWPSPSAEMARSREG